MADEARLSLILIVEDDEGIRNTLKLFLETEHYEVAIAENGKVALRMLKAINRPCLVLLDLSMPVMDGPKFLKILRTSNLHHMLATIPVVIQTAEHDPPHETLRHAHDLLKKPIDLEMLLNVVRKYCQKLAPADRAA